MKKKLEGIDDDEITHQQNSEEEDDQENPLINVISSNFSRISESL